MLPRMLHAPQALITWGGYGCQRWVGGKKWGKGADCEKNICHNTLVLTVLTSMGKV